MSVPRIGFFTDSLLEMNGVAHTSRHFHAYARRHGLPFLNVHAGAQNRLDRDGSVWNCQIKRSGARLGPADDVSFDLLFLKHRRRLSQVLKDFGAELIHITGPSDVGILGAMLAQDLGIPLIASWHTNVHEFAARRLLKRLSILPLGVRSRVADFAEKRLFELCLRLYRRAQTIFAPNQELIEMVGQGTGREVHLMLRGVDTELFSPARRHRSGGELRIGYVGRLSPEKSVRRLRDIETALLTAGVREFKIVIVGEGHERGWLESHLRHAEFRGVLRGEELARAYADLDLFVFPSHTDTFGNVVLEAAASGIPAIVTASGGPKFMVIDGVTGFVAPDEDSFVDRVVRLAREPEAICPMRFRARELALSWAWEHVFDRVYDVYGSVLGRPVAAPRIHAVSEAS